MRIRVIPVSLPQGCSSFPKAQPLICEVIPPHSLIKLVNKAISLPQVLPDQFTSPSYD